MPGLNVKGRETFVNNTAEKHPVDLTTRRASYKRVKLSYFIRENDEALTSLFCTNVSPIPKQMTDGFVILNLMQCQGKRAVVSGKERSKSLARHNPLLLEALMGEASMDKIARRYYSDNRCSEKGAGFCNACANFSSGTTMWLLPYKGSRQLLAITRECLDGEVFTVTDGRYSFHHFFTFTV
ncbi:unnamed protein product [Pieris brassicae]|uniref:Uncharacterized protein n=1 Tax=Pieris brassicae TaxID=7116 RepID=A0A9P0TRP8_PIEBR|nr:unnamed protein product [Pieris brassicae]